MSKKGLILVAASAVFLIPATTLSAQGGLRPRLEPGNLVRYRIGTLPDGNPEWQQGAFLYWSDDDLLYQSWPGDTVVVADAANAELHFQRSRSHGRRGALLGAAAGGLIAFVLFEPEYGRDFNDAIGCAFAELLGGSCGPPPQSNARGEETLRGAVLGGVVGFLIGRLAKTHRWEPMPGASIDVVPGRTGTTVMLSVPSPGR